MTAKEVIIEDLELPKDFADESISALLHTIFFVRAPNFIKPIDNHCKLLAPLIYAKCGPEYVDQTVKDAINLLSKVQIPLSPGRYAGIMIISFFEVGLIKNIIPRNKIYVYIITLRCITVECVPRNEVV